MEILKHVFKLLSFISKPFRHLERKDETLMTFFEV